MIYWTRQVKGAPGSRVNQRLHSIRSRCSCFIYFHFPFAFQCGGEVYLLPLYSPRFPLIFSVTRRSCAHARRKGYPTSNVVA